MKKNIWLNGREIPFRQKKILLVMKLLIVFILGLLLQSHAVIIKAQGNRLNLQFENNTLKEVLQKLEDETEFSFFYKDELISSSRRFSGNYRDEKVTDLLDKILKGENLTYVINGRVIVILPDTPVREESQQQKSVSGKVTDNKGIPLPGVTVLIKGKTQGTVTNADGNFLISNFPENATLVFSFVGMRTQEVVVAEKVTINVKMEEDAIGIEEVVAIGYGTREKGALTGAISTVSKEYFEKRPMTNTLSTLQGALPGVTVLRGSGRPGSDNFTLQIRGISSIGGNKPLILIDGIPGDLNLINPNDILGVSVLKDAAASIYGARAADGVILVTTQKGVKGKPTISYSGNIGIKTPEYLKQMCNTLQLVEMYDEGMKNINGIRVPSSVFDKIKANAEPDPVGWLWTTNPGFYQNTDWTKEVLGNGFQQSHNVNISGGGENNTYLFSAGYNSDGGIMNYGENTSDRYNLRMNYDFRLFDWLNLETKNSFDYRNISEPTALMSVMSSTPRLWSFIPAYTPKGQFYQFRGWANPVQQLVEAGNSKNNYSKFSSNIKAETRITNDLKLITQMGISLGYGDATTTNPTYMSYDWNDILINYSSVNSATYFNSKNYYGLYNAYLDYTKNWSEKHKINAMVGMSHEEDRYISQSVKGSNFLSNELFTLNLADKTKAEYITLNGSDSQWTLKSYFTRLSYEFQRKLFVDLTLRMDGSSKFAPKKRWSSVFPAASVAWNLSEEDFIKTLGVFNNLKLRGSWGQTGNQELSFGNYDYIPLVNMTGVYPFGSPNVGQTSAISSIASESRTWETIETSNIGLDFAFLQSKLTGSFDYFIKTNNRMLVNIQLPAVLGGSAPTQNQGKLLTKGWDIAIGWHDNIGKFKYSITAMVSDNKNKLIELGGNDSYSNGLVKLRQGYSLNSYFGYIDGGIIQNETELADYKKLGNVPAKIGIGDVMYKDIDGDGKISAFGDPALGTSGDMVYLGNLMPRYTYSSNINLSYKNFELGAILQGVGYRQGVRTGEFAAPFNSWWYQPLEYFYGKTWSADRTDAPYPRIIPGGKGYDELRNWNWTRVSERSIVDLAYMRVKVLTISYNLPETICSKLQMQNIRIYASGQDLFTFSKDTWGKSFDPEETWERSDEQTYPFTKVISVGLDLKF